MFCEWQDKRVKLYDDTRVLRRTYNVRFPVVGVQVSGEGNAARVAIAMSNGRTALYRGDGVCIRP